MNFTLSLGYSYSYTENTIVVGESSDIPRDATLAPISLGLSYASARLDQLGGRNFLTSHTSVNFGDALGASGDDEIQLQRGTAEADYWVERLQLARIQPLSLDSQGVDSDQWLIFTKLDGQVSKWAPHSRRAEGGGRVEYSPRI